MSQKYPTRIHNPALAFFFVIRLVASFEIIAIRLNNTLPSVLPHSEGVLEVSFRNGLQCTHRISFNRLCSGEPVPFERNFQSWEQPKVAEGYIGTVPRLAKLCNLVICQKPLHKVRWMRWCIIVVKKPVAARLKMPLFSSHYVTQSLQNFKVKFFVDRLTSWSIFMMYNIFIIEENNQHGLDIALTLTCFFRPGFRWKLRLWRLLFCFGIITVNPWFVTSNNLLEHTFIISDHFQVVLSDFEAKPFLLYRERFLNEFRKFSVGILETRVFGIPRSRSSSRTVKRPSSLIASRIRLIFSGVIVLEARPEHGALSTDVRPFLNRLYDSFICVLPIHSSSKAFCIISIGSAQLFSNLKQNLMQIRCSHLSVIFSYKQNPTNAKKGTINTSRAN